MELNMRLGDHMLVVQPTRLVESGEGSDVHEISAWIVAMGGPKTVQVEDEMQAVAVVTDFLAPEPDPNGIFAHYFPELMP